MNDRRPKRILIFSLAYYPKFIGGAEVAIKEVTDRLNPLEFEFDMITLRLDSGLKKVEKIGNVTIHRIGFSGKNKSTPDLFRFPWSLNKYFMIFTGFLKAISLHRKNKYDAIWSMMATYNSFAAILFKLKHPEVPYLLSLQEGDPLEHMKKRAKPLYPLFVKIFTKADHIQAISNYLANYAKDMGYKGEVSVVPNAVNFKHFSKRDEDQISAIKTEFDKKIYPEDSVKDDDFWIITTSRLVYKNAVDDIVCALAALPSNVKLLILGHGPGKKNLDLLIEELEVKDRIYFLGHVDHDVLPSYLQASDVFVRPSRSEGFGNSFIEAMAAGIPVIATEEGGIVDFLFHKKTGLICGTNDPKDVALKVVMCMKDIELRQEIVENAREMVREKYDWNLISEDMRGVFKKLVQHSMLDKGK